jgi:hypothetical protein
LSAIHAALLWTFLGIMAIPDWLCHFKIPCAEKADQKTSSNFTFLECALDQAAGKLAVCEKAPSLPSLAATPRSAFKRDQSGSAQRDPRAISNHSIVSHPTDQTAHPLTGRIMASWQVTAH